MSKNVFNKNGRKNHGSFGALSEALRTYRDSQHSGDFTNSAATKAAIGLENLTPAETQDAEAGVTELTAVINDKIDEAGLNEVDPENPDEGGITEGQRQAAIITAAAGGDPRAYVTAAANDGVNTRDAILDSNSVGTESISLENYDDRTTRELLPVSIAFNMGAANQDSAMEAVFPTLATTPDNAGLEITISRTMVHQAYTHGITGRPDANPLFNQKSLIDALISTKVLSNNATEIVPIYNTNQDFFDQDVGAIKTSIDGRTLDEGAIKFGSTVDLIGAASAGISPTDNYDQTDVIDRTVRLKTVYLKVTNDASKTSVIPLDTLYQERSQFQPAVEGNDREMQLSWYSDRFLIGGDIKDKSGADAEALEDFRGTAAHKDYVVVLKLSASGRINLADGHTEINGGQPAIVGFMKYVTLPSGEKSLIEVTDASEITAAKAKITKLELVSYRLSARFANLNRRRTGLLVRRDVFRRVYHIPLQSPITVMKPTTDTNSSYVVDDAVQAARVANTVAAIEELASVEEALKTYRGTSDRTVSNTEFSAIGTKIIRPFYVHRDIDLTKLVQNVQSLNLRDDLASAVLSLIADQFAKAMTYSGWYAAATCIDPNGTKKPTAVMVTSPRVANLLYVKGDTRSLGEVFNSRVEISTFEQFYNDIIVVPRRESSVNSPDGLNFGNMVWIPELITDQPNSRNGQQSQEFMIQTRRRHIVHCPILLRFTLKGIDDVLGTKAVLHTKTV